jgi:hypothetical protein
MLCAVEVPLGARMLSSPWRMLEQTKQPHRLD